MVNFKFSFVLFLVAQLITVALSDISDSDIEAVIKLMRQQDTNAAKAGDIVVNYQNQASHTHFDHDNAPLPFFTHVNENLFNGPTYQAYLNLIALFVTPDVFVPEPVTAAQNASSYAFLDAISNTLVYHTMWNFLKTNALASLAYSVFREQLHTLWFGLYSRGGKGDLGSSGFEHVFVGEYENNIVEGQHYWVRYYLLEKASQVNYHGWFDRQKDVQITMQYAWNTHQKMIGGFLVGTSPEFDFSLFTLCVLAKPGAQACKFMLDSFNADVTSYQDNTTGPIKVATSYPTTGSGQAAGTTTGRPGTTTGRPSPGGLKDLVNAMRAADAGKAQAGDIVLNWGNHVSGHTDVSPDPLFTHVNENLFSRPTYAALIQILSQNLFIQEVCQDESAGGFKNTYLHAFMTAVTNTSVFELAYQYLQANGTIFDIQSIVITQPIESVAGVAGAADKPTFLNTLFNLWFGTYSRCSPHVGSSGWEHVYSGEWKGSEIDGQHNWIRFYLLEKAGAMNYYGYDSHDGDLTGTFQYSWSGHLKPVGGFLIGTSPEFDFSLFTVCVLTAQGNKACKFDIDSYPLSVTSFTQACAVGQCISTSYPEN